MERRSYDRQSVWFYLCVAASALSLCGGACVFALYARTGSLGVGLGLSLAAALVGALGYAHASPLNKARCKLWFWLPIGVLCAYFMLFILCDLCRLRITYTAGADGNRYSAMAIVATIFAALCLAGIAFLAVRMALLATGRYATEAENRYARDAEAELPQEIHPRELDHDAVVAQAEHELDANRMVVESAPEGRDIVTPQTARARAARSAPVKPVDEVVEVHMDEVLDDEGLTPIVAESVAQPEPEVDQPEQGEPPMQPAVVVEATVPDVVVDSDIRAETAVQHTVPRNDAPTTDFADFSYDGHDDK